MPRKKSKGSAKKKRAGARANAAPNRPIKTPPPPTEPPQVLKDLGPPPQDQLEAMDYLFRMLVLSAYDAARDAKIGDKERRLEIRTISASAAKLAPRARIWQAEQLIKADRAQLEEKRLRRGAKLEPRPPKPGPGGEEPQP